MDENQRNVDQKGERKMREVDDEPRIHWYPYEHLLNCLPYGIAFPQGCESSDFQENFDWYLRDMQHNVDVKLEECLDQDGPPEIIHELLLDFPIERLAQFFKQNKPSPIRKSIGNPFLRPGISIEEGGCRMPGATHFGEDKHSDPVTSEHPVPSLKPKLMVLAMMVGYCMLITPSLAPLRFMKELPLLQIDFWYLG